MASVSTKRATDMVAAIKTLRRAVRACDPFAAGMVAGAVIHAMRCDDPPDWVILGYEFEHRLVLRGAPLNRAESAT